MSSSHILSPAVDLFNVHGLVAVVTGGGTGIGLMIAKALENNGATVYIASRRLEVLEQAAKDNNKFGNLIPIRCDVTNQESLQSLVDIVRQRHGYLDLLVNNAGISANLLSSLPKPDTGDIKALQQALMVGTRQDFVRSYDVNVAAPYYTSIMFLELLDAGNKRGRLQGVSSQIITVASLGGFRRDEKVYSISYCISKTATIQLGKMLANFLKDWQIRSNVIAPGYFPSEMTQELGVSPDQMKYVVPMNREGSQDDMAGLILYLASRAGAYINGSVQLIDGGRLTLFPSTY